MKSIIQKITDIATIVFPAIMAIFGVFHLTGATAVLGNIEQVVLICLGAASSIASVIYNQVAKKND